MLRRITSATITDTKIKIISLMVNISGNNMPLRATSIIPDEKVAPAITPTEATTSTIDKGAIFVPKAEFKKLHASFETPTNKSNAAKSNNIITRQNTIDVNI